MSSPVVSRCVNLFPVVDSVSVANFCEGLVGGVFLPCSLSRGRRLRYAGVVCAVPMADIFIFADKFFVIELFYCKYKEVRDFFEFLHVDALKFARASDPFGGREGSDGNVASLFAPGAFKFNEHRQWTNQAGTLAVLDAGVSGRRVSFEAEPGPCGSDYLSQECKSLKKRFRPCVPQLSRREHPAEYPSGLVTLTSVRLCTCSSGRSAADSARRGMLAPEVGALARVQRSGLIFRSCFVGVQRRCSCASERGGSAWML